MRRFGLIGFPLGHSFSRKYFSDKFAAGGITDCSYELFPIKNIDELPALLAANPDLLGLNVTIPYKKDVLRFLTDHSNLPGNLHACNCIRISGKQLTGFNTDVTGFRLSIEPMLRAHHTSALILGNGGATAAVKHALELLQVSYKIVSRNPADVNSLTYADLDGSVMDAHKVIINTTPLGTYPDTDKAPDIPYQYIGKDHLLYDLVYNPPVTSFMQKGSERGATVKNGYDMLVIQAEESWKIWNAD
jgi:shikimate dehydrogenase